MGTNLSRSHWQHSFAAEFVSRVLGTTPRRELGSEPLAAELVSEPLAAELVSEPLATGLISEPLAT